MRCGPPRQLTCKARGLMMNALEAESRWGFGGRSWNEGEPFRKELVREGGEQDREGNVP